MTIRGNIIQDNENTYGGGICLMGESGTGGTTVESNLFISNSGSNTAGIYVYWGKGPVSIRDNSFSENVGYYAGLRSEGTWIAVEGNSLTNNASTGYCIYNEYGNFVATANEVIQNDGSGIATRGGSVENNTVVGNTGWGITGIECSSVSNNLSVETVYGVLGSMNVDC